MTLPSPLMLAPVGVIGLCPHGDAHRDRVALHRLVACDHLLGHRSEGPPVALDLLQVAQGGLALPGLGQ